MVGLIDHHPGVAGELRRMKRRLHQLAIAVMLFAIGDKHPALQQVCHGVAVAPQEPVPFGHQHLAVRFGAEHYIRSKSGQRDLEEPPDMLCHHLQRSKRRAFFEQSAQRHPPGLSRNTFRSHAIGSAL